MTLAFFRPSHPLDSVPRSSFPFFHFTIDFSQPSQHHHRRSLSSNNLLQTSTHHPTTGHSNASSPSLIPQPILSSSSSRPSILQPPPSGGSTSRPQIPAPVSPSRMTFGVEEIPIGEAGSDGEIETDVPDDLQVIIQDRNSSYAFSDRSSSESPPSSPAHSVVSHSNSNLPPPPPPNRMSPRRAALQVPLPLASAFGQARFSQHYLRIRRRVERWRSSQSWSRDSSTFDFTGEIGRLNENVRASFKDQLENPSKLLLAGGHQSTTKEEGAGGGGDPFEQQQRQTRSSSTSPQIKGVIRSDFKFGGPLTPSKDRSPAPPRRELAPEPPTFVFRAPTPSSPPRSTFLPDTSFLNLSSPSSSETDMDVDMDPEFDTRRFSVVSDNSSKQRERRQGTHRRSGGGGGAGQDSMTSFASISSVGRVISGGSPDPFAFDFPSERMNESSRSLGYRQQQPQEDDEDDLSRLRMDSIDLQCRHSVVPRSHRQDDPWSSRPFQLLGTQSRRILLDVQYSSQQDLLVGVDRIQLLVQGRRRRQRVSSASSKAVVHRLHRGRRRCSSSS